MMANYQVRFGGGRLEKQVKLLAGRLPDLFGINANRVKPELRDRLITYQRECYQVLSAAFLDPALELSSAGKYALVMPTTDVEEWWFWKPD